MQTVEVPAEAEVGREVRRLGHERVEEREIAQRRLLSWGRDHPEQVLRRLPENDPDLEVRARCDRLRREVPYEKARSRALDLAGGDAALRERVEALFAERTSSAVLAFMDVRLGNPPGWAGVFGKLLSWEDAGCRAAVLSVVRHHRLKEILPDARKGLRDASPGVRAQALFAVEALSGPGDVSVSGAAEGLLRDPDASVRCAALQVCFRSGEPDAGDRIAPLTEDPERTVRCEALLKLGGCGGLKYAARIAEQLQAADQNVAYAAVNGLIAIGDARILGVVSPLLDHERSAVRSLAAVVIARQQGDRALRSVAMAKAWWQERKDDPRYQPPSARR